MPGTFYWMQVKQEPFAFEALRLAHTVYENIVETWQLTQL